MPELYPTVLIDDQSLKAYYRMEAGALTTDSSLNGNTLTNTGTVADGVGKFGGAADFGSADANKALSIASGLGITGGAITMVGWFNISTALASGAYYYFINQADAGTHVENFLYYNNNAGTKRVGVERQRAGTSTAQVFYNIDLGTATWYHIAYVYDLTNVYLYINGVQLTSVASSGNGTAGGTDLMAIGAYYADLTANNLLGLADDVAIFSRALSVAEINNLYASSRFTSLQSRVKTGDGMSVNDNAS